MNEKRPIPRHIIVNFQDTGGQRGEFKSFQTGDIKDRELKWHWISQQLLWKLEFCTWAKFQSSVKTFSVTLLSKNFTSFVHFLRKLLEDMHHQNERVN